MPLRLVAALTMGLALIVVGIGLMHVPSALIAAGLSITAAVLLRTLPPSEPSKEKERR